MASCISSYRFAAGVDFCFFWEQFEFDTSLLKTERNLLMPWISGSISPDVVWDNFGQTGIECCGVHFCWRKSSVLWIPCFSTDRGLPCYFAEYSGWRWPCVKCGLSSAWPYIPLTSPTAWTRAVQEEWRGASILLLLLLDVCLGKTTFFLNIREDNDLYKINFHCLVFTFRNLKHL